MTEIPDFDDLFAEQFLEANNHYRRLHGVPELQLSTELSVEAHRWAECLAKDRHLRYREEPVEGVGENITFFPCHMTAKDICDHWYKENKFYEYETPGWQVGTNYFTQIVWKDTKEVGVGTAALLQLNKKNSKSGEMVPDSLNDYQVVVVFYRPAGNNNHPGQFALNVSPPLKRSAEKN